MCKLSCKVLISHYFYIFMIFAISHTFALRSSNTVLFIFCVLGVFEANSYPQQVLLLVLAHPSLISPNYTQISIFVRSHWLLVLGLDFFTKPCLTKIINSSTSILVKNSSSVTFHSMQQLISSITIPSPRSIIKCFTMCTWRIVFVSCSCFKNSVKY